MPGNSGVLQGKAIVGSGYNSLHTRPLAVPTLSTWEQRAPWLSEHCIWVHDCLCRTHIMGHRRASWALQVQLGSCESQRRAGNKVGVLESCWM